MARQFASGSSQALQSTTVVDASGVSLWFYCTSLAANRALFSIYAQPIADRVVLYVRASDSKLCVQETNAPGLSGDVCVSTGTVSLNKWHHAWMGNTFDYCVSLDGETPVRGTGSGSLTGINRTGIGRSHVGLGSMVWDGRIADLACYDDDLSFYPNEPYKALAKGTSPLLVMRSFITHYIPMVHNDTDQVGKVAFTTVNSPTWADHCRLHRPYRGF